MKNTFSILAFMTLAAFVVGCGMAGSTEENRPATNSSSTKTADTAPASTSASVTGVPACDEYLALVDKFVNNPKVPQATRDMYKQTMEQNRAAWKQAASTPQGRAGLETSCKMALDAARPTLEQFGK